MLLSRRSEPRAVGKGTLHITPLPSLHQAKHLVFPNWAALVHVPNGPSPRAPSPLWNQSSFPQTLQCPFVHPLCPSVQKAPEEPPLILCSNNGAPSTPTHPCTTRILKSIDFNEISIPVSELLLCFVWVPQRDRSQGWDETSALLVLSRPFWRPGRRKAKGCDGQDQIPGTWQGVG